MAIFSLENVSFAYAGYRPSLVDISLAISSGERVALLGANGSGKSTVLHLLNGLYFAQSGQVRAFGTVLTELALDTAPFGPEFRRRVGFIFQNSDAQLFCPNVVEELEFGPLQLGLAKDEIRARVEDTLNLLGISALRDRAPQTLSAGQKRLVAVASALTMAPSVLLLDEPTAGLDARSQGRLLDVLDGMSERGVTLVSTTHDLTILTQMATRSIVLSEDHRIIFDGTSETVLNDEALLTQANLMFRRPER